MLVRLGQIFGNRVVLSFAPLEPGSCRLCPVDVSLWRLSVVTPCRPSWLVCHLLAGVGKRLLAAPSSPGLAGAWSSPRGPDLPSVSERNRELVWGRPVRVDTGDHGFQYNIVGQWERR